jgi:molybdenum cofactor guanylyltransferase
MKRGTQPLLSAVILAGGQSCRMGCDKAWIKLGGQPLMALALDKVRELGVTEVFISGRPGGDYSSFGCPVLLDLEPGLGPLSGIERGLYSCPTPLLLVLAVDLPQMTPGFLRELRARSNNGLGVVPQLGDQFEPLAAIYPKRCHRLASERILHGSRAVRDFTAACLQEKAIKRWRVPPSQTSCLANWNRPEDVNA